MPSTESKVASIGGDEETRRARENQCELMASRYAEFKHVSALAQSHLVENSNIAAIWLFGSRARGTAIEGHSGWDLALVMNEEIPLCESIAPIYCLSAQDVENDIRCFQIPRNLFYAKRTSIGHHACAVAAEGIPLAEREWRLEVLNPKEKLSLDLNSYQIYLGIIDTAMDGIGEVFQKLALSRRCRSWNFKLMRFVAFSQEMAEAFIKAGFLFREKHVLLSHDFGELAIAAEEAGIEASFVRLIRRLNGVTDDEAIRYSPADERKVYLAAKRIEILCEALPIELTAVIQKMRNSQSEEDFQIVAKSMRGIVRSISDTRTVLESSEKPRLPIQTHSLTNQEQEAVESFWRQQPSLLSACVKAERQLTGAFD